ncbi:hypothetical protein NMY22_g409 [Coprinellus aureogranulatus]|nr:hypothetical protein NMY22_g409 [Coprinellus aureogranulatus]
MASSTFEIRRAELSFQTQYIIVIALSILFHDYGLNFSKEVNWIWRAPNKSALTIILYVLNRYLSIVAIPIVLLKYFWTNTDPGRLDVSDNTALRTPFPNRLSSGVCDSALVAAVLIQRAYALYGKSKLVLAGTCAITVVAGALGIVRIVRSPSDTYKPQDLLKRGTCILPTSLLVVGNYMPSIITAMVLEVAIFVLTLIKSIQHMKSGSRILEILLRDGIFYFALVMLAHFGVILSYYLPHSDITRGNLITLGNWWVLSCVVGTVAKLIVPIFIITRPWTYHLSNQPQFNPDKPLDAAFTQSFSFAT